ncbi:MAG: 2'-5' RNA ligase family protein [candidate division KSB1 bacterium]|nr:2'-5' RNA ligase family protein [candidate division KSB1 bacterium]
MPNKTHKTAVVILPPETIWEPIQRIRRAYDRNLRRWMPHITLLYPFLPVVQFDRVTEQFQGRLRSFEPFELQLSDIRYFKHGRERFTLWLAPEPAEAVAALQERLWQAVPECDETRKFPGGFVPHLSIGQVSRRSRLQDVLQALQRDWRELRFRVQSIALIWRNDPPDDVFRVDRVIPF